MLATQVLSEDVSESVEKEDNIEETIGFILVNDSRYEIKTGETKIGRDPTMCSVVIENTTVSKVHAVIESDGIDDTFIYDVGSTNQTKLGKKTLKPQYRYKLENNSNITLGNITVKFLLPSNIIENLESRSDLDNFKTPLVPEDIFDAVTQVTVYPHLQASGKTLQLGKGPESVQIFKSPDFENSTEKPKVCHEPSKDFIKVTECQSESKDLVPRRDCYNSLQDTSGIFSLSTQCQIVQPCSSKESKSEVSSDNHRDNKFDPVKAFLCDDQDEVLCTFMSLHSPGELSKQIKTEVQENSQLFDVQTQVQAVFNQPNCQRNSEQILQFNKDYQDSTKPNTGSSQFDGVTEINPADASGKVSIKDTEEDFIKTQVFFGNPPSEKCRASLLSPPVSENIAQESDTVCYFEDTIDLPATQGPSENDDLISTQKFEVLPKETTNRLPENEELSDSNEDLMETQLYDFVKEKNDEDTAGKAVGAPLVVSESPVKDSEPSMTDKTDFTQRNAEEDFISTQAFCKMTQDRNAGINSSGASERVHDDFNDDEDFIATQPVNFLHSSTPKNKCFQEPIPLQTSSREGSPDLLDSEKTSKDFTSKKSEASSSELWGKTDSLLLASVKKELDEDINMYRVKSVERVESSGEETESDLEILFDKSSSSKKVPKIGEFGDKTCNVESQQPENGTTSRSSETHENNDSNSSYIFQVEPETHATSPTSTEHNTAPDKGTPVGSDSDATDCEDVAVIEYKMPVELPGKITCDETQLRTLTPPNRASSADEGDEENGNSPVFEIGNDNECWSQLSLEMPDTQDMENTVNKILCDDVDAAAHDVDPRKEEDYQTPSKKLKTEVKIDAFGSSSVLGKQVDFPLKRLGNDILEAEVVPPKKSKIETSDRKLRSSERQFLKLWQVHNIEQIQPYRTRSSLKNSATEKKSNKTDISLENNISNKFATSRRESRAKRKNTPKPSPDITQYLFKKTENSRTSHEGRKKETSPKMESKPSKSRRVLRSSRRNSHNILPHGAFECPARQSSTSSTRSSRFKKYEYFDNPCVNVVFTGFDCESLEKIISNLGGKKAKDLSSSDVVVADKVRRTVKFLSAIALSLPITSPEWLLACRAEKKFLNPWDFILEDKESERKWDFELKAALERSKNAKLMQGLNVYATESAKPPVKDLMAIVKYCGGTPLFEPPDTWPKKTIIVSCPEDKKFWPPAKFRNIKIVHYEFVLIGVLRQELDYKAYKLR